jgi:hypothetical protein
MFWSLPLSLMSRRAPKKEKRLKEKGGNHRQYMIAVADGGKGVHGMGSKYLTTAEKRKVFFISLHPWKS